jgi:hypothetical protein
LFLVFWCQTVRGQSMPRPKATRPTKDLAASFALAVTAPSECCKDLVSRSGRHSIFDLFAKLVPKVTNLNDHKNVHVRLLFEKKGFEKNAHDS